MAKYIEQPIYRSDGTGSNWRQEYSIMCKNHCLILPYFIVLTGTFRAKSKESNPTFMLVGIEYQVRLFNVDLHGLYWPSPSH